MPFPAREFVPQLKGPERRASQPENRQEHTTSAGSFPDDRGFCFAHLGHVAAPWDYMPESPADRHRPKLSPDFFAPQASNKRKSNKQKASHFMRLVLTILTLLALALVDQTSHAFQAETSTVAQALSPEPESAAGPNRSAEGTGSGMSFWQIVRASGVIGLLIFFISVAGLALVIEHALTIRRAVLIPEDFLRQTEEAMRSGQAGRLAQSPLCRTSTLGRVVGAGLAEMELGWPAVEKAMEEALAEESARLYRKVEYLSVIGNLAPMLGLLGTVVGMIVAFRQVAETQGAARAADLAEGIYLALVTTVEGLLVAIPALAAFAFFRNKVDALIAEVALTSEKLLRPLKRELMAGGAIPPRAAPASARLPRSS